jgi:hypothetical protein
MTGPRFGMGQVLARYGSPTARLQDGPGVAPRAGAVFFDKKNPPDRLTGSATFA